MLNPSIFLFSGEVRSGKTTVLRHWIRLMQANGKRFAGAVSLDSKPAVNSTARQLDQSTIQHPRKSMNLRRLMNVSTQKCVEFELESENVADEFCVKVGRFVFSKSAFAQGIQWLQNGLQDENTDWLVLDEIGMLELHRNEGFEPELTRFFEVYHHTVELRKAQGKPFPKLILVVREALVSDFELQHGSRFEICKVFKHTIFELDSFPFGNGSNIPGLYGLVLGGGQSSRMGYPKYRIIYQNHQPQWQRLTLAMQEWVVHCGINIPKENESEPSSGNEELPSNCSWEFDHDTWGNSGPIGGILSYFEYLNDSEIQAMLVVAVDYPYLRDAALKELMHVHRLTKKSVFYLDDSTHIINGLIGVYSKQHLLELRTWFKKGNQSLSRFLKERSADIFLLTPQNWIELTSVDE